MEVLQLYLCIDGIVSNHMGEASAVQHDLETGLEGLPEDVLAACHAEHLEDLAALKRSIENINLPLLELLHEKTCRQLAVAAGVAEVLQIEDEGGDGRLRERLRADPHIREQLWRAVVNLSKDSAESEQPERAKSFGEALKERRRVQARMIIIEEEKRKRGLLAAG